MTQSLILKCAPIGWNQENYDVLDDGVVVGRVFLMPIGLKGPALDVGDPRTQGTQTDARL